MANLGSIRGKVRWKPPNLEAFFAQLDAGEEAALEEVRVNVQQIIKITVGTQYFTLQQLRAMRHEDNGVLRGPYSLVSQRPPMFPGVINAQSYDFYNSIQPTPPIRENGIMMMGFISTDMTMAGNLMAGSYRMMKRDFRGLLQARIRNNIKLNLSIAAKNHLKAFFKFSERLDYVKHGSGGDED